MPVRIVPDGGTSTPGTTNTLTEVTPAIELSQRFDLLHSEEVVPGVSVAQGPITAQIAQSPGVSVAPRAEGTPVIVETTPGIALTQRLAQSSDAPVVPAFEIQQVKWDLEHLSGASVVDNVGTFAWSSPANAQGLATSTAGATMAGSATAARDGVLRFVYDNHTAKSDHTITLVRLHFYVTTSGTVANNGDLRLYYRTDGVTTFTGATNLEVIAGNVTNFSSPRTFDVTGAIAGDWTKLDNLVCFVQGRTDIAEAGISYAVNAVEVEIEASVTDPL